MKYVLLLLVAITTLGCETRSQQTEATSEPTDLGERIAGTTGIRIEERFTHNPKKKARALKILETQDTEWIRSFIDALGPKSQGAIGPDAPCLPTADVTFFNGPKTLMEAVIGCAPGRVDELIVGDMIYPVKDSAEAIRLIQTLKAR